MKNIDIDRYMEATTTAFNRLENRLSALERAGSADPVPKDLWASIRNTCLKQADKELMGLGSSLNNAVKLVAMAIAIDVHVNDLSGGAAERFVDLVLAGKA